MNHPRSGFAAAAWVQRFMRRASRNAQWVTWMRLTSYPVAGFGPLHVFACACFLTQASASARRRAQPRPDSDGWPFASLRVPCDARLAGPVAELAAFAALTALTALKQLQRVSSRSALHARPASLCFSAAPIRPAQAAPAALPAVWRVFDEPPATMAAVTEHPGSAQRACEAPSSTGCGARARSALRGLTRRACSTTVSAANGGSCATGPRTRAGEPRTQTVQWTACAWRAAGPLARRGLPGQGSLSAAKTASPERCALPGCPVAAPRPADERLFKGHSGPPVDNRGIRGFHASRVARSAMDH